MGGFVRTQKEFRDFQELEEFQQSMNLTQQPTRITQLERGQPCIRSRSLQMEGMELAQFELSHRVRLESCLKPGQSVLILNLRAGMHVTWNGATFPEWGVALLRGGHSYDILHKSGFASVEIAVSDDLLSELGLIQPDADPTQIALPEVEARLLARGFSLMLAAAQNGEINDTAEATRQQVLGTFALLMDRLEAPDDVAVPCRLARARVARAEQIIEEHLHRPLDLPCLAETVGVSTRTLRREFLKVLGITPKAYQLARRLEAAKRALRQGACTTVADVSDLYGFSHPSRFAEHYKRQFGERPSVGMRSIEHRAHLNDSHLQTAAALPPAQLPEGLLSARAGKH